MTINTEQGVLQSGKTIRLLINILLSVFFYLSAIAFTEAIADDVLTTEDNTDKHHVYIIYSAGNTLHENIIRTLTEQLKKSYPDIVVSHLTPEEETISVNSDTDMIIGIGSTGMRSAANNYPGTSKLFIATDPEKYRLDKQKNKKDAILYMTQSYCGQIHFIRLLNKNWQTISLLNSDEKPIDKKTIQQCANEFGMKIFTVDVTATENMTRKIKVALDNSDVMLALPDQSIYNSKTVKNILLTSYRKRKPVIAFSKNFVNAGALASIYSDSGQIALSASELIRRYFDSGNKFATQINHPQTFDISINKQVFRALELPAPDTEQLKRRLIAAEHDQRNNR